MRIYKVDEGTAKDIESTAEVFEGTVEVNENTARRFMWCAHGCLIFIMESMDLIRLLEVYLWLYDVYEEAAGVIDIGLIFNQDLLQMDDDAMEELTLKMASSDDTARNKKGNEVRKRVLCPFEDSKLKSFGSKSQPKTMWILDKGGLGSFDWSEDADNALSCSCFDGYKVNRILSNSEGNPERTLKDHALIDVGCSGSMTGDKDKLSDFKDYKGGYVAFGNDPKGGRITGKGTIKTSCIDFENVSYVKELKFNLLSVSQICDKKHNVLFTDTECLILSPEFKIVDENLVLLRAPRKNDVYSLNLKSIIPSGGVTCLVAKASEDEAILWHRRLGHVNFKNINKLVKSNLVRGLPSKTFKHDHSCLACRKGKQHKASCKKLEEKTVREP
ncbi:ribonuclease H-like domain-containing protein [Tanacetum coccineum]